MSLLVWTNLGFRAYSSCKTAAYASSALMMPLLREGCINSNFDNLSLQRENDLSHYPGYLFNTLHFWKIESVHVIVEVIQEDVQQFRKSDPPENVTCPCSAPMRDVEHIIRHCPHFTQQRLDTAILSATFTPIHPLYPYHLLLGEKEGMDRLLKFLGLTKALSKLETGPPPPVPPEPD
ncbi:hypothetical protein EDB85DRAFT_1886736 [Lactarius pseudohatsudake]|nr:hypothetical protein EDB85DRAFT_1886736 [Lactarius pseudohatsudake]